VRELFSMAKPRQDIHDPNDASRSPFVRGHVDYRREKDKPMLVGLKRISTAFGLLAAFTVSAQAQTTATGTNQKTANAVAESLKASKALSRYRIEIEAIDGKVTLSGRVNNSVQRAEAIARAQRVTGVAAVIDQLSVASDRRVRPAQYQTALGGHHMQGNPGGEVIYDGAPGGMGPAPTVPVGPMPEGAVGAPGATQAAIAGQPNYAWPAAGMGTYPTTYPWQAQANVVPEYPNPEIPLGWRRVSLRWDDGIWWLDFRKTYTRPFFTPWPFQIWAY
jgi:hypothetical protein